ncbi:MAG: insulinase family protein, partial [Candidatus Parcubacteria bacterium]|nr:insulinase family protein [Candidatus Parcubacteria bacterium]
MFDPYADFKKTTLPNGLAIHALRWPNRPWEAIGILVHSGAEHDPIGFEGLAHFVEHLVSENANIPKKEMNTFFEKYGGMVDFGATGYPYAHYRFFLPALKNILAKAFSMFGHMLISAKLKNFIERERKIIINEFHCAYPAKFQFDLDMQKHRALYSDSWLGRFTRPLGNPESIGLITQKELQSYYDAHYTPANISIVGVGN